MQNARLRIDLGIVAGLIAITAAWGLVLVVPALPVSLPIWGPLTDFTTPAAGLGGASIASVFAL